MKRFIVFNLLFFIFILYATYTYAGIAVQPTVTEMSVAQGKTVEGIYTVINTGTDEMIVTIKPVDWLEKYLKQESTADVNTWLSFDKTEFSVSPGEMKKIKYTVTVPYKLMEEQVAQVYFAFRNKEQAEMFKTRLGVIFYLGIKGKEHLEASVDKVQINTSGNEDGTYNIRTAAVTIKNSGNVHIRPFGVVRVRKNHEEVARVEIKSGKGIYAGKTDIVYGIGEDIKLTPGTYEAEAEIDCGMYDIENKISKKIYFTI